MSEEKKKTEASELVDAPKFTKASDPLEAPRFMAEALFLANSYTRMLEERKRLEKLLAGSWVYTKEMAIDELDNITVSYEGERVQTSNISNPTERIAVKLTDEYMARKQAEMDAERNAVASELEYLNWKIGVVETVCRERMNEKQKDTFTLIFVGHKTYRDATNILKKKRKIAAVNRNISKLKREIRQKFIGELSIRSGLLEQEAFMVRLSQEVENEANR